MTSQRLYNRLMSALFIVPFVIFLTPILMIVGIVAFAKTIRIK
jgi:hypothetical protein